MTSQRVRSSFLCTALVFLGCWAMPAWAADSGDLAVLEQSGACSGCDLSGADLRERELDGAEFRGADLRGVALHAVRLAGADLRDTDLRHLDADLDLEFVDLRGVRLEGARFADGVVCGPMPDKGGFGCAAGGGD